MCSLTAQRRSVATFCSVTGSAATNDCELYQETKRRLAQEDWPTMQHYAEAKSEVVEAIIRRALDAAQRRVSDAHICRSGSDLRAPNVRTEVA